MRSDRSEAAGTVVIAGAGIAGLTAALALSRKVDRVVVLERTSVLSEAGAGIQLGPNAGRVLARLGLDLAIARHAAEPEALDVFSGRSGARLATMPLGAAARDRFAAPYRTIHRADLQAVLLNAVEHQPNVEIHLGAECLDVSMKDGVAWARAATATGSRDIAASAIVGADGVHSSIRRLFPGAAAARFTGRTAWRAVLPRDGLTGISERRIGLWLGPDAHLVHYPVRRGAEINVVAVVRDDWRGEGWSALGDADELTARFRHWGTTARTIVAAPPRWRKWAILTHDPAGPMAMGPLALIGDAAHAMSPYFAQGGVMAIEDAVVLADELAQAPLDATAALMRYESRRRERVARVWRTSARNGNLFELRGPLAAARDLALRAMGGAGLAHRTAWVYGGQP